jgi:branched-subunit amino acid transport protein
MTWGAVLALAAGTYAFRLAGPVLRDRLHVSDRVQRLLTLGAVALLAALIATAALTDGGQFAGFARPAGVAVGALVEGRRLLLVVVVLAAAGTTALLRAFGVP